jgi:hypothetical protein
LTQDSIAAERAGLPTVTLALEYFASSVAMIANSKGVPGIRRHILPGPFETFAPDKLRAHLAEHADEIVAQLETGKTTSGVLR